MKKGTKIWIMTLTLGLILTAAIGFTVASATGTTAQERLADRIETIQSRVDSGTLTQEQADAMIAQMTTNAANCTCTNDGTCTGTQSGTRVMAGRNGASGSGYGMVNGTAGSGMMNRAGNANGYNGNCPMADSDDE
jgi:hypothetical protein